MDSALWAGIIPARIPVIIMMVNDNMANLKSITILAKNELSGLLANTIPINDKTMVPNIIPITPATAVMVALSNINCDDI